MNARSSLSTGVRADVASAKICAIPVADCFLVSAASGSGAGAANTEVTPRAKVAKVTIDLNNIFGWVEV